MNPKSQIHENNGKIRANDSERRAKNRDLTLPSLPAIVLLKHFTNSRPRLPLSSVLVTHRLRGSGRGQSGHLVSGTGPYCGHFECVAEEEDICDRSPEKRKIGERGSNGRWRADGHGRSSLLAGKRWVPRVRGQVVGPTLTWMSGGSNP